MIPVMQTKFGAGVGNCWEACIASILEIAIEDVPDFPKDDQDAATAEWLDTQGYYFANFKDVRNDITLSPGLLYIVGGKSPRFQCLHAVVFRGREMVHDPHPDGTGLDMRFDYSLIFRKVK